MKSSASLVFRVVGLFTLRRSNFKISRSLLVTMNTIKSAIPRLNEKEKWSKVIFVTILLCFSLFFFVQPPRKVCIANRNIGQKFVFLKNKYISVILAFVVCSIKLVTSAVGISLPLIFCL